MTYSTETVRADERPGASLLRVLGVTFGLAVTVGNTVGVGILRAPGEVAGLLPWVWVFLAAWVAGGLYALLGANSLAELGTRVPRSGGQYAFARRAFGDYAGFVVGWSDWVSTCGSVAAVSIALGEYAGALVPRLAGQEVKTAAAVTVVFTALQWRGVSWGGGAQNVTSLLKGIVFVLLVAACFALGGGGTFAEGGAAAASSASSVAASNVAGVSLLFAFVLALQSVIYTYDGWTGVIYFSEEVRDPARDIPRSMLGGVLLVIALYLVVNLAFLYVLPLSKMAGEGLVAGAAAEELFGARGGAVILVLSIVALLSSVNALLLIATRVPFALGRDGLFPPFAVRVNRGGTPTAALGLSALVALLFALSGSFQQVVAVLSFFFVANYAVSFAALFVLRRRGTSEEARVFRARGHPWTTALALLGSLAFLAATVAADRAAGRRDSLYALAVLAASYPAYLAVRGLAKK